MMMGNDLQKKSMHQSNHYSFKIDEKYTNIMVVNPPDERYFEVAKGLN